PDLHSAANDRGAPAARREMSRASWPGLAGNHNAFDAAGARSIAVPRWRSWASYVAGARPCSLVCRAVIIFRRGSFRRLLIAIAFVIYPHPLAVFVPIVRIDRKDVEAKALAVAAGNGTAPEAMRLAVRVLLDAPLNAVAVVLLLAVQATNQRGNGR